MMEVLHTFWAAFLFGDPLAFLVFCSLLALGLFIVATVMIVLGGRRLLEVLGEDPGTSSGRTYLIGKVPVYVPGKRNKKE